MWAQISSNHPILNALKYSPLYFNANSLLFEHNNATSSHFFREYVCLHPEHPENFFNFGASYIKLCQLISHVSLWRIQRSLIRVFRSDSYTNGCTNWYGVPVNISAMRFKASSWVSFLVAILHDVCLFYTNCETLFHILIWIEMRLLSFVGAKVVK